MRAVESPPSQHLLPSLRTFEKSEWTNHSICSRKQETTRVEQGDHERQIQRAPQECDMHMHLGGELAARDIDGCTGDKARGRRSEERR